MTIWTVSFVLLFAALRVPPHQGGNVSMIFVNFRFLRVSSFLHLLQGFLVRAWVALGCFFWPLEGSWGALGSLWGRSWVPLGVPRATQEDPRGRKSTPRGPTCIPRATQEDPRAPQEDPRAPQDNPRSPRDTQRYTVLG